MKISSQEMSFNDLLNIPIPFLIDKYNHDIIKIKDKIGFSLSHYAVSTSNFIKCMELLYNDADFTVLSNDNKTPLHKEYNISSSKESTLIEAHNIYFINNSYSALHLNAFLHGIYSKNNFRDLIKKQFSIFKNISILNLHSKDNEGLTITDYCFLMEDYRLINLILDVDTNLDSLTLPINTSIKIFNFLFKICNKEIDTEEYHYLICDPNAKSYIERILQALEVKKNYLKLNASLKNKNIVECNINKI